MRSVRRLPLGNLEQLQPERLDLVEHAVEGGLVGKRSAQHCVRALPVCGERRERFKERRAELAADADLEALLRLRPRSVGRLSLSWHGRSQEDRPLIDEWPSHTPDESQ